MGKKLNTALVGLTALGAGSCSQPRTSNKSKKIFADRVRTYQVMLKNEASGIIVPHKEYKDVQEYLKTGKVPDHVTNPKEKNVEQPNSSTKPTSEPAKGSLFDHRERDEQEDSKWRYSITPLYARKMAVSSKEQDPNDMNMFGFELGAKKDRLSFYLGAERGQATEEEDGTENGLDYKGQIDITHTTLRTGLGYDLLQGKRGRLTAKGGLAYTMEDVDGYIQIATPNGTERLDIDDEDGYGSIEGELEGALKLGKNVELTGGIRARRNFGSDNVETELILPLGVKVKF